MRFHDFDDDDRSPRCLIPSGSMDKLKDGAQHLPDLRGAPPSSLRTPKKRRKFPLDVAILTKRREGMRIADIARWFDIPRHNVVHALERCERLAGVRSKAERAG